MILGKNLVKLDMVVLSKNNISLKLWDGDTRGEVIAGVLLDVQFMYDLWQVFIYTPYLFTCISAKYLRTYERYIYLSNKLLSPCELRAIPIRHTGT
jgi:hypothetical protein